MLFVQRAATASLSGHHYPGSVEISHALDFGRLGNIFGAKPIAGGFINIYLGLGVTMNSYDRNS